MNNDSYNDKEKGSDNDNDNDNDASANNNDNDDNNEINNGSNNANDNNNIINTIKIRITTIIKLPLKNRTSGINEGGNELSRILKAHYC